MCPTHREQGWLCLMWEQEPLTQCDLSEVWPLAAMPLPAAFYALLLDKVTLLRVLC